MKTLLTFVVAIFTATMSYAETQWQRIEFRDRDTAMVSTLTIRTIVIPSVILEIKAYDADTRPQYRHLKASDWVNYLGLREDETTRITGWKSTNSIHLNTVLFGVISIPYSVSGDTLTLNVPGRKGLVFSRVEQVPTAVNTTSWGSVKSSLK